MTNCREEQEERRQEAATVLTVTAFYQCNYFMFPGRDHELILFDAWTAMTVKFLLNQQ